MNLAECIFGVGTNKSVPDRFFTCLEMELLKLYNPTAANLATKQQVEYLDSFMKSQMLPMDVRTRILSGQSSIDEATSTVAVMTIFGKKSPSEMMNFAAAYFEWAKFNGNLEFISVEDFTSILKGQ